MRSKDVGIKEVIKAGCTRGREKGAAGTRPWQFSACSVMGQRPYPHAMLIGDITVESGVKKSVIGVNTAVFVSELRCQIFNLSGGFNAVHCIIAS